MARILPFNAVMFDRDDRDFTPVTAPPYDVISPEQRLALLAKDPHNVVALELPEGPLDPTVPDNRYETGRRRWRDWRSTGVLREDDSPAIYVLEQTWEHEGRPVRRRAFVGAIELRPFADGVVLPHERTLPKALDDRLNLTRSTAANLSQVFSLFSDPGRISDAVFDRAMAERPLMSATDADGVISRVWAIRDAGDTAILVELLADQPVFIADGHHRYTTSLAYRDERRTADGRALDGEAPRAAYDYVMMALVNMDDPDLVVLPTHRVVRAGADFDPESFWFRLSEHFEIGDPTDAAPHELISAERTAFVVRTADGAERLARLRSGSDPARIIGGTHSDAWKRLDVTVLQEMILAPLFGVHPDEPASLDRLRFVKEGHTALEVAPDEVAFMMRATGMDELRAVALNGETMPQKSTYFYPKLLSGLLMRSLD
ncbi:MAG: DUF1015 domain-containing protein [Anaerosomatales bacterium]|nr:DUF1015 domain-containing protein [Anaerosomatales bacterium]